MQIGKKVNLKVVRKSNLGYMLTDSSDEVLLHFNEATRELNNNEEVEVFIYFDKQGRKTATMKEVSVTLDNPGYAEVVEVISNLGVFVTIGTNKDILISKDYLPYDTSLWPLVGEKLLITIKVKRDTIVGKILNRFEIEELDSKKEYELNESVGATVYRVGQEGVNLVSSDLVNIYVHKSHLRDKYHVGQNVIVRIIHKSSNGYNGSLIGNKEQMIDPDKELILKYLDANGGRLRLDSKSSSEEIEALLHISRKAFKRALGGLYKDRVVDFKEGYTYKI